MTGRWRVSPAVGTLLVALLVHLVGMALIQGFGSTFGIRAMLVLASLLAIASIGQTLLDAARAYREDVEAGVYPAAQHEYGE